MIILIIHNPTAWNSKDQNGRFVEPERTVAIGKGGDHQRGNGNSIVMGLSDLIGMETIAAKPYAFVTTPEKVKGYRTLIDGEWVTTPPEMQDKAQYDGVYTPNHPNELVAIPAGYDTGHLTL